MEATTDALRAFGELERMMAGAMSARALVIAHKLGVFQVLAAGPLVVDALAEALSVRNRPAFEKLLDINCKLDLLTRDGRTISNSKLAQGGLLPGRPGYYGDFIEFFSRQFVIKSEQHLLDFTRDAVPVPEPEGFDWSEYMRAMECMANISADRIARVLDLANATTLLDLGGGSGRYAVAFCAAHPQLSVTIRDLDEVRGLAMATIAESAHRDRIRFETGNFVDTEYPTTYDAIFISHVIHLFPEEYVLPVMETAHRFLNPGGQLIVRELFVEEGTNAPLLGLLIGYSMWIHGGAYTFQKAEQLMRRAGFADIERRSILDQAGGPQVTGALLVGRR